MEKRNKIIFANEFFYTAFNNKNLKAMEEIWYKSIETTCVHPGWPIVRGYENIIESWDTIFKNSNNYTIKSEPYLIQSKKEIGYVICHEVINNQFLIAINIFIENQKVWQLIHHQAGASPKIEDEGFLTASSLFKTMQ